MTTPDPTAAPRASEATLAAETEAASALATEAAPDNPNPDVRDQMSDVGGQRSEATDLTSDIRPPTSEPKPLERITTSDRGRADIAARFKEKRAAAGGQVEFHGNFQDPSQTYGPYAGQGAPQMSDDRDQRSEEQPPAQQHQQTTEAPLAQPAPPTSDIRPPTSEQQPALTKLKVHGVEMYLPQDQVIAEAQKSLAAGNLLESAKEVLSGARQPGQPAAPTAPTDPVADDSYTELAQTLQLEPDAKVAGAKLKETIVNETAKARQEAAREAGRQVRLENELAASQRALQAFEKTHPDLAADEFARDSITTQVQREINADLTAAVSQGILKELPKTQDERNGLHTQLRAFGAPVRPIGDIFAAAGTKYATWRGGTPAARPAASAPAPQTTTTQSTAPAAPRVELTTARQERRAQIPTQPTNGTVPPRPAPPPEQTTAGRRSAAIMAMRKARGQIVA
jgi:hypothetical protein